MFAVCTLVNTVERKRSIKRVYHLAPSFASPVLGELKGEQGQYGICHRHVYPLALSRFLPVPKRDHAGDHCHISPARHIGHLKPWKNRLVSFLYLSEQAGQRNVIDIVRSLLSVRAILAKACDGEIDNPRIERDRLVVAYPYVINDARAELLHHHIGSSHKIKENYWTLILPDI